MPPKNRRQGFPERSQKYFDENPEGEEFEAKLPGVPDDAGDPLWTIYGINPGLPFRIKVEQLIMLWDLDEIEIVNALNEDHSRVHDMVEELKKGWMALGEGLSDEEKTLARGKMITELLRLKNELERLGPTQDSKIINMKISLAEKIAKLRGVEKELKETVEDEVSQDPLNKAISDLSPDAQRTLLEHLRK